MKTNSTIALVVLLSITFFALPASAHVPYLEYRDYSFNNPFTASDVEQSIAAYAWLEWDDDGYGSDVDVYRFEIEEGENLRVYIQALVPVCEGYEDFAPWFALTGPGVEGNFFPLPFALPEGYGMYVMQNAEPGEPRNTFYEPFGGKSYYESDTYEEYHDTPGTYYVVYWDPYEIGGDYVAVIGNDEIWGIPDIIRALINTPLIRQDKELHIECL